MGRRRMTNQPSGWSFSERDGECDGREEIEVCQEVDPRGLPESQKVLSVFFGLHIALAARTAWIVNLTKCSLIRSGQNFEASESVNREAEHLH